jgi:DNA-binding transcriptional LysR family regulator
MDRLYAMSTLLAAVEAGSLSGASRRLGMPLATVSRKVSELEGHLGTRLVNRTRRRLTLTDAGRSYVVACKRILEDIGEAERAAAGEYITPRGDLIITAPVVFGRLHALPIAIDFLRAYSEIDIRVVLADRMVNLQEEDVDLAIRIGELPDSSLVATRVGSVRRVVVGSPAYFAAHGTPQRPEELGTHDCITFDQLTPVSAAVRARLSVTTAEAAIDAAVAGVGVARVLSYQVAAALRAGTVIMVLQEFEPAPWPVSLVHAGHGRVAAKLRAFLDFAAPRLKARLAQDQE